MFKQALYYVSVQGSTPTTLKIKLCEKYLK